MAEPYRYWGHRAIIRRVPHLAGQLANELRLEEGGALQVRDYWDRYHTVPNSFVAERNPRIQEEIDATARGVSNIGDGDREPALHSEGGRSG